ncbi:MAG: hypothetical protein ACK41T_07545 [Pseudobdellovibrio sp.]
MFVSEHQPHKQFFRRNNNVKGLNQARRGKRELIAELDSYFQDIKMPFDMQRFSVAGCKALVHSK